MIRYSLVLVTAASTLSACATSGPTNVDRVAQIIGSELDDLSLVNPEAVIVDIDLSGSLTDALKGAVIYNPTYISALHREQEAYHGIGIANSARRPQVSSNVRAGGLREIDNGNRALNGTYGNLSVSQLLFDGGASAADVDAALARYIGARAERVRTANEVAATSARAWVNLWLSSQRLVLFENGVDKLNTAFSQIERMADSGMTDTTSVQAARRQLLDVELERASLEQEHRTNQANFERYFRSLPEHSIALTELISMSEASDMLELWHTSPALKVKAAELVVAREELLQREAQFSPRTTLQARSDTPLDDNDTTDFVFGLSVDYVIANGGQRTSELAAAQERVNAAESALLDAYSEARAASESAKAQLDSVLRSWQLARDRSQISAEELETVRSQLVTGQSNLSELITAEITYYRSADRVLSARAELILSYIEVASSIGLLTTRIGIE